MQVLASPFAVFMIPILAIIGFFVYRTVEAIATSIRDAAKHRADTELKIVLAQRGMSASEIERVVGAKAGSVAARPADETTTVRSGEGAAYPPNKHAISSYGS